MRKQPVIHVLVCFFVLLVTSAASAQPYERVTEKRVAPVKGKKLVVKGAVYDGDEVVYKFKARPGQRLDINLIGRDADFSFSVIYELDVNTIAQDTTSWSGRLPSGFTGNCEIAVHSNYKLADYRLEILLK